MTINVDTGKIDIDKLKKQYPEIASMTIEDVINSEHFAESFKNALMAYKYSMFDFYAFVSLRENGTLEIDNFRKEYIACINKVSKLTFNKRVVIFTIGNNTYSKTIKKLMDDYDTERK